MNKRDIELLAEATACILNETDVPSELVKSGHWCKDKDWPDPKKLHSSGSKECEDEEEGGTFSVGEVITYRGVELKIDQLSNGYIKAHIVQIPGPGYSGGSLDDDNKEDQIPVYMREVDVARYYKDKGIS